MKLTSGTPMRLAFMSAIIFILLIVYIVRSGTADKSGAYIVTVNQDTRPQQPQVRVKAFVQPRPGSPMQETEMLVHRTPGNLPIVDAKEVALDDDDLVLGIVIDDKAVAFPIRYLAMFEVTNSQIGDVPVAPTWCPLTGTGIVYLRTVGDRQLTFDFGSGLLNNNLLVVDRETLSVWSQLNQSAISGPMKGTRLTPLPAIQSTWKFWLQKHPDTRVMTFEGQEGRRYLYRNFDFNKPRPRTRPSTHDTSALGLGLHIGDQAYYFPFTELKTAKLPIKLNDGDKLVTIHYVDDAITAWAEDAKGKLLPSVLVYKNRWLAFNPKTTVYKVSAIDD